MEISEEVLKQLNERFRFRHLKLAHSITGYVRVLFLFALLQIVGISFFTRGFLLSRQVLPDVSTCSGPCFMSHHQFENMVVVVIDALRFDFTIPVEGSDKPYYNHFPILHQLASDPDDRGVLLKFIADPPTTTLQRLKGLTTGSLPTFIDAGSNFNGDTLEEDNWIAQLYRAGKRVAFAGDDTWTAMFSPYLDQNLTFPYDSLKVWDLHTVDDGCEKHLFPLVESANREWDVLITHFLGLDHCGHRYGPDHFAVSQKLDQMNAMVERVVESLDQKTLLVVMGDHGMDSTGNHGGESDDEVESALFLYSKQKGGFPKIDGPQVYSTSDLGNLHRRVNQIDLVPTVSMLLGLPIPFNNLGMPVREGFSRSLSRSYYDTVSQINKFRQKSAELASDFEVNSLFHEINHMWHSAQTGQVFVELCERYQKLSLERCKSLWATFDLFSISVGIILTLTSIILLVLYSKLIPPVVVSQLNNQFFKTCLGTVPIWLVAMGSIYNMLRPENLSLAWSLLLGLAVGIVNGIAAPIMDRYSVPWLFSQILEKMAFNGWSYMGILYLFLHCLLFTSNSFIIWEDRIVHFLVSTFALMCLFKSLKSLDGLPRLLAVFHSAVLLLGERLVMTAQLCREEQQQHHLQCFSSTFATSRLTVGLLYASAFALPAVIKGFYRISFSYQASAKFWIGKGLRGLMVLIAMFWTLDYVEHSESFAETFHLIKSTKMTLARIVLGASLVAGIFGWSFGPICVDLSFTKETKAASISGYGNMYGSSYFLLVINFLAASLLVSKPLGQLSMFVMVYQLLSLLELTDLLNIRNNLISVAILVLLSYSHFFASGHQATLQSIQWETGFIFTDEIKFPLTHLAIVFNTFGPFIIGSLCVGLLCLWKIPPSSKPIALVSRVVENATMMIIYQGCLTLSTLIMTAVFRRHLMVWKIFAPRFMLNGLLLVLMNVLLTVIVVAFGTRIVVLKTNSHFGK